MNYELYNIQKEVLELLDSDELATMTDEEFNARIKAISEKTDDVLSNLCAYHKNLSAYSTALKAEKKNLDNKIATYEDRAEKIKKALASFLGEGKKWDNGIHTLLWRKSEQMQPTPENADSFIPEEYQRTKIIIEADKAAMKEALKAGADVAGWQIVNKQNLQIK